MPTGTAHSHAFCVIFLRFLHLRIAILLYHFLGNDDREDQMECEGDDPCDRIGQVDSLRRGEELEYGLNPKDSESTNAAKRDDHSRDRAVKCAERRTEDLHDSA